MSPPTATIYTGPSNTAQPSHHTFTSIHSLLTTSHRYPVLPSPSPNPHSPSLAHLIASLHIHPALEALLHLLNSDLPSAHFLCRHMQNAPAYEGMFIHGVLHRIEGDYRNAEAWYGNVAESDVFARCWPAERGGLEGAKAFIRRVEELRKGGGGDEGELEGESKREIEALIQWCEGKFGLEKWEDGTEAWVEPSAETREIASKQLTGGEGWRQF